MAISDEDKNALLLATSIAGSRCFGMLSHINLKIKSALRDMTPEQIDMRLGFAFTTEGTKRVLFETKDEAIKAKMAEITDSLNTALKEFHDYGIDVVLKMSSAPEFIISASQISILCFSEEIKTTSLDQMMKETFTALGPIQVES